MAARDAASLQGARLMRPRTEASTSGTPFRSSPRGSKRKAVYGRAESKLEARFMQPVCALGRSVSVRKRTQDRSIELPGDSHVDERPQGGLQRAGKQQIAKHGAPFPQRDEYRIVSADRVDESVADDNARL